MTWTPILRTENKKQIEPKEIKCMMELTDSILDELNIKLKVAAEERRVKIKAEAGKM